MNNKEAAAKIMGHKDARGPICYGCHNGFTNLTCPAHGGPLALAEYWKNLAYNQRSIAEKLDPSDPREIGQKIALLECAKTYEGCANDIFKMTTYGTDKIIGIGDLG